MNQENVKRAPALCRWIAKQWDCEQVIVVGIDGDGPVTATYGTTPRLCQVAKVFGGVAIEAIEDAIRNVMSRAAERKRERECVRTGKGEG